MATHFKYKVIVNKIPRIVPMLGPAIDRHVMVSAEQLQTEWRDRMFDAPRGGEVYTYQGREHKASAPGEVPAVKSGEYLESIYVRQVGVGHYIVGSDVRHAAELEYGTVRYLPRPVAGPLAEEYRHRFTEGLSATFSQIVL